MCVCACVRVCVCVCVCVSLCGCFCVHLIVVVSAAYVNVQILKSIFFVSGLLNGGRCLKKKHPLVLIFLFFLFFFFSFLLYDSPFVYFSFGRLDGMIVKNGQQFQMLSLREMALLMGRRTLDKCVPFLLTLFIFPSLFLSFVSLFSFSFLFFSERKEKYGRLVTQHHNIIQQRH